MGMAIDAAAEVISDLDLPREDIEAAVRQVYRKRCDSLTRMINGRSMQEHFEGCEIYQPGVIVDVLAGVAYRNETEARNA